MSSEQYVGPDHLGYLLKHAFMQLADRMAKDLAPLDLEGRELSVLTTTDSPELLSQQQLAQRLRVDRTTMVAMLDTLERKGLIARVPDPDDRRRNVVELTDKARVVLPKAMAARDEAEREFLGPLTAADRERLREVLKIAVAFNDEG